MLQYLLKSLSTALPLDVLMRVSAERAAGAQRGVFHEAVETA